MYYEINVSLHGVHLFATAERSIREPRKLEQVIGIFKDKFPECEGYKITITQWNKTGKTVEI